MLLTTISQLFIDEKVDMHDKLIALGEDQSLTKLQMINFLKTNQPDPNMLISRLTKLLITEGISHPFTFITKTFYGLVFSGVSAYLQTKLSCSQFRKLIRKYINDVSSFYDKTRGDSVYQVRPSCLLIGAFIFADKYLLEDFFKEIDKNPEFLNMSFQDLAIFKQTHYMYKISFLFNRDVFTEYTLTATGGFNEHSKKQDGVKNLLRAYVNLDVINLETLSDLQISHIKFLVLQKDSFYKQDIQFFDYLVNLLFKEGIFSKLMFSDFFTSDFVQELIDNPTKRNYQLIINMIEQAKDDYYQEALFPFIKDISSQIFQPKINLKCFELYEALLNNETFIKLLIKNNKSFLYLLNLYQETFLLDRPIENINTIIKYIETFNNSKFLKTILDNYNFFDDYLFHLTLAINPLLWFFTKRVSVDKELFKKYFNYFIDLILTIAKNLKNNVMIRRLKISSKLFLFKMILEYQYIGIDVLDLISDLDKIDISLDVTDYVPYLLKIEGVSHKLGKLNYKSINLNNKKLLEKFVVLSENFFDELQNHHKMFISKTLLEISLKYPDIKISEKFYDDIFYYLNKQWITFFKEGHLHATAKILKFKKLRELILSLIKNNKQYKKLFENSLYDRVDEFNPTFIFFLLLTTKDFIFKNTSMLEEFIIDSFKNIDYILINSLNATGHFITGLDNFVDGLEKSDEEYLKNKSDYYHFFDKKPQRGLFALLILKLMFKFHKVISFKHGEKIIQILNQLDEKPLCQSVKKLINELRLLIAPLVINQILEDT